MSKGWRSFGLGTLVASASLAVAPLASTAGSSCSGACGGSCMSMGAAVVAFAAAMLQKRRTGQGNKRERG